MHNFNNDSASRTTTLIRLFASREYNQRTREWNDKPAIRNALFLTGTPILNRVTDYFTMLHLCDPAQWANKGRLTQLCVTSATGKPLAINRNHQDWFLNRIGQYVIRRMKKDVLTDLPPFTRDFDSGWIVPENAAMAAIYNELLNELEIRMADSEESGMTILGIIARLRAVTGEIKAKPIAERAFEEMRTMLEDDDPTFPKKIAIGIHHHAVSTAILRVLKALNDTEQLPFEVFLMDGSHSAFEKMDIENKFRESKAAILVASTIACGEGRNMQFCNRFILGEREWNAAKEEQFEQRFWRKGQQLPVEGTYVQLGNSIDQWLHEIVELKRTISASGTDPDFETDSNIVMQIAAKAIQHRMKVVGQ
jgi:hypothetical protein